MELIPSLSQNDLKKHFPQRMIQIKLIDIHVHFQLTKFIEKESNGDIDLK